MTMQKFKTVLQSDLTKRSYSFENNYFTRLIMLKLLLLRLKILLPLENDVMETSRDCLSLISRILFLIWLSNNLELALIHSEK